MVLSVEIPSGSIQIEPLGCRASAPLPRIRVAVDLQLVPDGGKVAYLAAKPPERRVAFSGSGLPYANASQAFSSTPNQGVATVVSGMNRISIELSVPNSYYEGLGAVLVPPTVFFHYRSEGRRVRAHATLSGYRVPYRTLTYPPVRRGAMFYSTDLGLIPEGGQFELLKAGAYPPTVPDEHASGPDFWRGKPPL